MFSSHIFQTMTNYEIWLYSDSFFSDFQSKYVLTRRKQRFEAQIFTKEGDSFFEIPRDFQTAVCPLCNLCVLQYIFFLFVFSNTSTKDFFSFVKHCKQIFRIIYLPLSKNANVMLWECYIYRRSNALMK